MLLPSTTRPPTTAIERRHSPARTRFGGYRQCLRWDFGFTCAFCLLHEADLEGGLVGVDGTGLTTIEHWQPQATTPQLVDEYSNCFYACRFCNRARGSSPISADSGQLLNPCISVWSEHFTAQDDQLVPATGDRDALRTEMIYDLNDRRKMAYRCRRRERIEAARRVIGEAALIPSLLSLAQRLGGPDREKVILAAESLRNRIYDARAQLRQFAAIPVDADPECRCRFKDRSLPVHLACQCTPRDG